jgi:hypothetical protein
MPSLNCLGNECLSREGACSSFVLEVNHIKNPSLATRVDAEN